MSKFDFLLSTKFEKIVDVIKMEFKITLLKIIRARPMLYMMSKWNSSLR